jgi:hypothetical protein
LAVHFRIVSGRFDEFEDSQLDRDEMEELDSQ